MQQTTAINRTDVSSTLRNVSDVISKVNV